MYVLMTHYVISQSFVYVVKQFNKHQIILEIEDKCLILFFIKP